MKSYPYPPSISTLVCSDLDETIIPFAEADKCKSGITALEKFLERNIMKHSILFGIITGSNLKSTLRKIDGHAACYPHFIVSSMGTELHWFRDGQVYESAEWERRVRDSGYRKEYTGAVLDILRGHGINLTPQPDDYQGKFKSSFYYKISDTYETDLERIRAVASDYNMSTLSSRCNPNAGDPENHYDIEFIPVCCGKGEAVDFLKEKYGLAPDNIYCFGDSFNDFPMFARTANSFLVGNADEEAKKSHPNVLGEEYCLGIKNKLEELLCSGKH